MSLQLSLKGKVAIVTGASQGIGKAMALKLAEADAIAVICSRRLELISAVADEIKAKYGHDRVIAHKVDVSKRDEIEVMVSSTIERLGRVDILINNAGIVKDSLIIRMSDSDWDNVISVNLTGSYNGIRAVSPHMIKQRSGRIINISSISGVYGNAGQTNYSASKAGIIGMTKAIAKELGRRGITANVIAPGFIDTEMTASISEEQRLKIIEAIPLRRFGSVEDVAEVAVFLASDAAGYINGQVIQVDGGLVI
jgi:3-oxoacyl-[acyl-carrier protein] reductase